MIFIKLVLVLSSVLFTLDVIRDTACLTLLPPQEPVREKQGRFGTSLVSRKISMS